MKSNKIVEQYDVVLRNWFISIRSSSSELNFNSDWNLKECEIVGAWNEEDIFPFMSPRYVSIKVSGVSFGKGIVRCISTQRAAIKAADFFFAIRMQATLSPCKVLEVNYV